MSSVTPTDAGSSTYYMKHLTELENELKTDHARSEERSREQVEDLGKKYQASIAKVDERTTEAVDKIRKESQEGLERSKEFDRNEAERAKRQTYDRFGRDRGNEADAFRAQRDEVVEGARVQHEHDSQRLEDAQKGFETRMDEASKAANGRTERAIQLAQESADKTYRALETDGRSLLAQQRKESEERYTQLNRSNMEQQQADRRRLEANMADNLRDVDNQKAHADQSLELRLDKDHRANLDRIETNTRAALSQHGSETQELRDQIRDLLSGEGRYIKEYGQGMKDAVKDNEDLWRTRERLVQEKNASEVNQLKDQRDAVEGRFAHANDRSLHEREGYFTNLIAKTAAENRADRKELIGNYERDRVESDRTLKNDRVRAQETLETALGVATEQRTKSLDDQARSTQQTIENQRSLDAAKIDSLELALHNKTNNPDPDQVSPAVENAVRRSVVKEYEKNFAAEADRNKRLADSLQTSYAGRMQSSEAEHQQIITQRLQENQTERHQEQARFLEHMLDTEYEKDQALRSKDGDHDRQTENLNRVYSQMGSRQRAEYENMLQTVKEDAATRLTANKQESEFQLKTAQRTFSTRQNELIREYEKKLADQKTEFDDRVEELRSQTQQTVHETERHTKNTIEEQARGYEQRIAQIEAQNKDHERSISQNYEDQLEKVKRSNALQSKKS